MKIIGVTGGIGSGKSTVSSTLKDLGAAVIDADVLARNVTSKGTAALNELVGYFGEDILNEKGKLDRAKLASIAFSDRVRLNALNSITHKYVAEKIYATVELLKSSGKWDIAVIDAPIPIEQGFLDLTDEVWVVSADRETRIKRVMVRNGSSYENACKRVEFQLDDDDYLKLADEIIYNNGTIEELEQDAVKLFLHKKQEWQR